MTTDEPSQAGPRASTLRIRVDPEDFVVDEIPLYPPSGEGAHTFVRIEKRLADSDEVARALARVAGVAARDVGYAGRKDRRAVTRQWFSVPGLAPESALALDLPGVRVIEAARHVHKLRTGQLRGNRFEIRIRGAGAEDRARAERVLVGILQRGMPNRFGSQRFGRDGRNAERARALLGGAPARTDRRQARFLISALQAEVFNRVLSERPLPLDRVERGDVARLTDSGGLFVVEDEVLDNERAARFEISATGPIFGTRVLQPAGEVALREAAALFELGLPSPEALRPPPGIRLRGARRPLRVLPQSCRLEAEPQSLVLHCILPAGSYVTVLLEELFPDLDLGASDTARATGVF